MGTWGRVEEVGVPKQAVRLSARMPRVTMDTGPPLSSTTGPPLPYPASLPSTSPLLFPWKPAPLHPRASAHGLSLPAVLFTPPFAGVTPLFLLVSDGCQVLKDLRPGLPPPSPALMEPQDVAKMPPVYTASSVSTGLLPDTLSVSAGHRQ